MSRARKIKGAISGAGAAPEAPEPRRGSMLWLPDGRHATALVGADWKECVARFAAARRRQGLREQVLRNDQDHLGWLEQRLPLVGCPAQPAAVRREHLDAVIDRMVDGTFFGRLPDPANGALVPAAGGDRKMRARSINIKLNTWRLCFGWWHEEGLIAVNPADGVEDLQEDEGEITWLYGDDDPQHPDEVGKLLATMRWALHRLQTFSVLRDYASAKVQLDTGMRPGELVQIRPEDVDVDGGVIRVDPAFCKTRDWRDVYIIAATQNLLRQYIAERARQGFECPQLFCNSDGSRTSQGTYAPMLTSTYTKSLERFAGLAKLHKKVTAYTLRHTFARLFLREGASPADVQALMGHSTSAQTPRYIRLWGRDLQTAYLQRAPMRRRVS